MKRFLLKMLLFKSEIQKDTERLNFLEQQHVNFDWQLGNGWSTSWTSYSLLTPKNELRKAIDAAIKVTQ